MKHEIVQPADWAPPLGYANGIKTRSGQLHIGGQIGWDGQKQFVSDDFVEQLQQALTNIRTIVETAGGRAEDVVRMTWFVTNKAEYLARQAEVGRAYRSVFGKHFPAMSMLVVAGLIEDRALVEIEATAEISG